MFTCQYNLNRSGKAGVEPVTPPPPSRERPSDSQAPRYDEVALFVSDEGILMTLESVIAATNTVIYVLFCQLVYADKKTYDITHVGMVETLSAPFQWGGKDLTTIQFVPLFKAGQGPLAAAFSSSNTKVWNAKFVTQDYISSGTICLRPAYEFLVNDEPAVRRVTEWTAQVPASFPSMSTVTRIVKGSGSESDTSVTYDTAVCGRNSVSTSYDHCTPFVTVLKCLGNDEPRKRTGFMADLISPIAIAKSGNEINIYWLVLFKLEGQTTLTPRFQKYNNYSDPVSSLDNVSPVVMLLGEDK